MENFNTNHLISQLFQKENDLQNTQNQPEISIILPCRNEQEALPKVLNQIKETMQENNLNAEIIISDSSSDNSIEIIKQFVQNNPSLKRTTKFAKQYKESEQTNSQYNLGRMNKSNLSNKLASKIKTAEQAQELGRTNYSLKIRILKHNKIGYGNAYLEAFPHAKSDYIFMADCDGTYNFKEIPNFLKYLKQEYDFVIGNRFAYKLEKKVMPLSHKYIGNPILSGLLRLFYKTSVKDSHCGMRAITKKALKELNLQTKGMEFASEMVIKALKSNLRIKQLPIQYHKRIGKSKLNTMTDGWRHLRFMLLYSPLFLFFIPGFTLFTIGIITLFWFYSTNPILFGITFYTHPMFISSLLTIIGYQLIIFSVFAKTYAINHLNEKSPLEKLYKYMTIEKASIIGIFISLAGLIIFILILCKWIKSGLGDLNQIKNSILALTLITIGIQTIFSSFMLSILGIKEK